MISGVELKFRVRRNVIEALAVDRVYSGIDYCFHRPTGASGTNTEPFCFLHGFLTPTSGEKILESSNVGIGVEQPVPREHVVDNSRELGSAAALSEEDFVGGGDIELGADVRLEGG